MLFFLLLKSKFLLYLVGGSVELILLFLLNFWCFKFGESVMDNILLYGSESKRRLGVDVEL